MLEHLLTPGYVVFAASFVVMVGIGLVEAIGLGIGHLDLDADIAEPGGWAFLDWLGLKSGLPILVWLTSLSACFTLVGLVLQQIAEALFGGPLHWAIAVPSALLIGLVANAFCSGIVARFIPEYESTVVSREALLRRRATVLEGTARRGYPARAKVIDQHGTPIRLTWTIQSTSSSAISTSGSNDVTPALATTMDTGPNATVAASAMA